MLTIYRRHLKTCEHPSEGREYRRCRCPIWVDGFVGGKEIRRSLKQTNWERAADTIQTWEADGTTGDDGVRVTIEQSAERFIADAEARKLKEKTIYKYRLLFRQFATFSKDYRPRLRFVDELKTAELRDFRASWKDANLAALKKLERLRSFFRFAHENGWIRDNPLVGVKNPKVIMRPTLPFSRDEMLSILEAAQRNIARVQPHGRDNARRLRALILLLRYTGLRIGDAVSCSVERLEHFHK